MRRGVLAVVLVGAAVIPSRAVSQQARHCTGPHCRMHGSILWTARLSGSWLAESGVTGTVPGFGAAYAATGGGLAVLGSGLEVTGYQLRTGVKAWQVTLSGMPGGSAITSVRAFAGVVAVGVQLPQGQPQARYEVILSAGTGRHIRTYPAAAYGGTIAADNATAVIVGATAVTAYANATGRVRWSEPTGPAGQAWRVSGQYAYLAQVGGAAGVQAVRQINLRNGAVRVLRPTPGSAFPGALSAVVDGVLLFSQAGGVVAYGSKAGAPLWKRDSSVLELTDPGLGVAYLASGNALDGVDVDSGAVVSKTGLSVAGGLYWVAAGVAVGLDENALGAAWGYDLGSHRVLWTSAALPWPHFFTDMSGLGGSMSEGSTIVLLAVCAKVGGNYVGAPGPACLRPELAAVLV